MVNVKPSPALMSFGRFSSRRTYGTNCLLAYSSEPRRLPIESRRHISLSNSLQSRIFSKFAGPAGLGALPGSRFRWGAGVALASITRLTVGLQGLFVALRLCRRDGHHATADLL